MELVALSGLLMLVLTWLICFGVHVRHVKFVQLNSPIYQRICMLNRNTTFWDVQEKYVYTKVCKSKAIFDRTDVDQVFFGLLSSDKRYFFCLFSDLSENRQRYREYLEEFEAIQTSGVSERFCQRYRFFKRIEKKQCERIRMNPPTLDVGFSIFCRYTSPKGKNSYSKGQEYNYDDLAECLTEIRKLEQRKATKEYQRSIMTSSLRYDVMKRDGFRCVLCGATVQDGVKLHVDHILPVSKGGKTELSNLRTLCENCNLGKRDKYDPAGMN